jgi:hypothetical protein
VQAGLGGDDAAQLRLSADQDAAPRELTDLIDFTPVGTSRRRPERIKVDQ